MDRKKVIDARISTEIVSNSTTFFSVMADCPHTIGVEFGTRIIEVSGQKIKLQIWVSLIAT